MNLNCLNSIITDNLAINIDISQLGSWNLNTGLTLISLNKWNNAISDDIELLDFGLTAFDNGRVNSLNDAVAITQNDNKLLLNRIGFNNDTGGTYYSNYTINSVTGGSVGNYFSLDGGYLQGFFKLYNYNYELLSPRYNNGITIETVLEILPESQGIFYYMGARAEDKYNQYYTGETEYLSASTVNYGGKDTGFIYHFTGITTSEGNYLISYENKDVIHSSFPEPENKDTTISNSVEQLENIANNIISFELTEDKKIMYRYVDVNGGIVENESSNQITRTGWTIISIVYKPYNIIANYDTNIYWCYPRRKGDLIFYVNGKQFWKITDFDEFYFNAIGNDREKQLGVPFNISWGGGSFGLKHSWHFNDFSGTTIAQDSTKDNLFVERYFDSSYVGNIQKLRIYDKALYANEILHNASIEAENLAYLIQISKGGRIIYR